MTRETVEAIVDKNEMSQTPEILTHVMEHPDVEGYGTQTLPAADLEIGGVGFERKTVSDYVQSLMDDRLDEQTMKLGQRYEIAYLLVDGDTVETKSPFKSNINGSSIRGSWASLTAREDSGVRAVIPCSNLELLVDMAVRLARKHVETSDRTFIPSPDVEVSAPTAKKMYACIPGVGPEMAEVLYQEYPTINAFVTEATYESLQELDGIGEHRAVEIIWAIA